MSTSASVGNFRLAMVYFTMTYGMLMTLYSKLVHQYKLYHRVWEQITIRSATGYGNTGKENISQETLAQGKGTYQNKLYHRAWDYITVSSTTG